MLNPETFIENKPLQNIAIWTFLFIILLGTIQSESRVLSALFGIILLAPPVYIHNLYILPKFNTNKPLFFGLLSINILVFTLICVWIISVVLHEPLKPRMYINFLGIMMLTISFGSALKLARDGILKSQQQKEAEIKLLKAQLNPHFLFNTLNNLYGLSVLKSDKLPELMLKLSDLLRYNLYETKDLLVPLEKEIQYLENYIALEKIRLEDSTDITRNISGDPATKRIAPMLFIIFIENAFKHLGTVDHSKSHVGIEVCIKEDYMLFTCINTSHLQESSPANQSKPSDHGIGLQNVKKRLNLIYPEKHTLSIEHINGMYTVNLKLVF